MGVIRLTVNEQFDFFIFRIAGDILSAEPEAKKQYEKMFRLSGLKKFRQDNRGRFLQKERLFLNSLNNKQVTRIEIETDPVPGEITPDEKRPTITKKLMRIIRRLTGTKNEGLQEMLLHELVIEQEKLWESENLAEKYLT
jgi:hypothetical protein